MFCSISRESLCGQRMSSDDFSKVPISYLFNMCIVALLCSFIFCCSCKNGQLIYMADQYIMIPIVRTYCKSLSVFDSYFAIHVKIPARYTCIMTAKIYCKSYNCFGDQCESFSFSFPILYLH